MPPALPAFAAWRRLALLLPLLLGACAAVCQPEMANRLPLVNDNARPLVPGRIDGQPAVLLLDTGAMRTALLPEALPALNLPGDSLRRSRILGFGGESNESNTLINRLELGSLTLEQLTVPVVVHGGRPSRALSGLIGADLLRAHELEMDAPGGQVTLYPAQACSGAAPLWPGPTRSIPVELYGQTLPIVTLRVNGRPVRALFDTGAQRTLLPPALAISLGMPESVISGPPSGVAAGIGLGRRTVHHWQADRLEFAGLVIDRPMLQVADVAKSSPFAMVLGQDVIGQRRFWLSYARQRLFFDAGAEPR
ncbi:hypothetical protein BKE38_14155 [Pseudoroseomonas deserti]|uniref:Peptidase A2 domain-containing protein n=1 Tax=Teichococcus deserti TaxID=1817963 RepID=A0A1V2H2B3_9PROT|nr:retroviral-like aspartic protease family protein [Pseudoroseomonas deserti]ONG52602.1 hypothetical protein BKE38_14155 [Pseudoroseomonas deserti]